MIEALALFVVVLTGVYFIVFAGASFIAPDRTIRFLRGFAGNPFVHYLELSFRLIVGGSLVVSAPNMFASAAIAVFGWILLVTTTCILFLPWRWHYRFAQQIVPRVTRYIAAIGLCSLALGVFILAALLHVPSAKGHWDRFWYWALSCGTI